MGNILRMQTKKYIKGKQMLKGAMGYALQNMLNETASMELEHSR